MNTKPFDIDPPKPVDPIAEAKLVLRKRFEKASAEESAKFDAECQQAWIDEQARQKATFIAKYRYDNAPSRMEYPYAHLTDAEILRIASNPDERIPLLLEAYKTTRAVDFLAEATKVWLYRRMSRASLADVKNFLKDQIPVAGDEQIFTERVTEGQEIFSPVARSQTSYTTHKHVTASGLSSVLKSVLHSLTVQHDVVYFVTKSEIIDKPAQPGERWTLAHEDEDYPAQDW